MLYYVNEGVNLEFHVVFEQDVWDSIKKNYENENYEGAILDAMYLLTETIRTKTGLEGDGASLVGQAFGGENPRIQLNKLQTESERDAQKGVLEILKGLYTAIRNPRSHDRQNDSKMDADSIIYFICYLLRLIGKSKTLFELEAFQRRVFDKHFVNTEEYSELLINEIPKRYRTDVAISLIKDRKKGDIYNLATFMQVLFDKLNENELTHIYKTISEELKFLSLDNEMKSLFGICPGKYWKYVDKAVKIRIEKIFEDSVIAGTNDLKTNNCRDGALGTWIELEHLMNFESISGFTNIIVDKLTSGDKSQTLYVNEWFWDNICAVNHDNISHSLKVYFRNGLKNKDMEVVEKLKNKLLEEPDHPWWKVFDVELKMYPEIKYEDVPF